MIANYRHIHVPVQNPYAYPLIFSLLNSVIMEFSLHILEKNQAIIMMEIITNSDLI